MSTGCHWVEISATSAPPRITASGSHEPRPPIARRSHETHRAEPSTTATATQVNGRCSTIPTASAGAHAARPVTGIRPIVSAGESRRRSPLTSATARPGTPSATAVARQSPSWVESACAARHAITATSRLVMRHAASAGDGSASRAESDLGENAEAVD